MQTLEAPSTVSGPPARRRGRPRDLEADKRILASATELILECGFDDMTIDEVASRASVGKATVYRRWARKEDLALAAMAELYDQEFYQPDTGTLHGDLLEVYAAIVTFTNSEAGKAYVRTAVTESMRDQRIRALYRAAQDRASTHTYQMFARALDRGEIRAGLNLRWAVDWIGALVVSYLVVDREMPSADEVESMIDFVLRGVGA